MLGWGKKRGRGLIDHISAVHEPNFIVVYFHPNGVANGKNTFTQRILLCYHHNDLIINSMLRIRDPVLF
jgi:hypothetical protein